MEVNKLESREVLTLLFGIPVMITLIVLASIGVGHYVTTRSDRPTNVTVAAATPKIDVNVPQTPAPKIQVTATPPNVDVNVPAQTPPMINVTTPPAVVTVIHDDKSPARLASSPVSNDETPKAIPAVLKPQAQPATRPAPEPVKAPAPDAKKNEPATSAPAAKATDANNSANDKGFREEDLTLDNLYRYAEKYVESYCQKNNLDANAEAKKWNTKWQQSVEQAIKDNTDTDEQSYINRIVVQKRDHFDLDHATPDKVVEACRIMLRYRDGKLAWMKAMRDAITSENMKKTLVFLSTGPR